jgi:hypothetical protein
VFCVRVWKFENKPRTLSPMRKQFNEHTQLQAHSIPLNISEQRVSSTLLLSVPISVLPLIETSLKSRASQSVEFQSCGGCSVSGRPRMLQRSSLVSGAYRGVDLAVLHACARGTPSQRDTHRSTENPTVDVRRSTVTGLTRSATIACVYGADRTPSLARLSRIPIRPHAVDVSQ